MNIESLMEVKQNPNIPPLNSGDTVKVSTRVVEGDKERTQMFQGVIIKVRNRGVGSSFTVRRVTYGVGVERTFPIYSPRVEKVEIVRRGKKRRAKLYYLRGLSAKTSRLKERRLTPQELEREREEALRRKQELETAGITEVEMAGEEIQLEDDEVIVDEMPEEAADAATEAPKMEESPDQETGSEQEEEKA